MTTIPVISNFEGDFVMQLVSVGTNFTMDQVAEAAAYHTVNRRVRAQPGRTLRIRLQDGENPFSRNTTVKEAGFIDMQNIDVYYE